MKNWIVFDVDESENLSVFSTVNKKYQAQELAGEDKLIVPWHSETMEENPPKKPFVPEGESTPIWTWPEGITTDMKRESAFIMDTDLIMVAEQAKSLQAGVAFESEEIYFDAWINTVNVWKEQYLKDWIDCTASTDDTIGKTTHGINNGDRIEVRTDGGSLPAGLSADTKYWAVEKTDNDFKLSDTEGGSAKDITSTGSNVQYRKRYTIT